MDVRRLRTLLNVAAETRQRLLDSALKILAEEGSRALTLRRVESVASVPHGTARYHFGTSDCLVDALIGALVTLDMQALHMLADRQPVDAVVAIMRRWLGPERKNLLARYELMLLAARRPEHQKRLQQGTAQFSATLAALAPAPASTVIAQLDGLMLSSLTRGPFSDTELREAVTAILGRSSTPPSRRNEPTTAPASSDSVSIDSPRA